jgi:hypothetical protein
MGFGKKIGFRLIGFMIFFSTLIMLISSAIQVKVNYNRNISEIRARQIYGCLMKNGYKRCWMASVANRIFCMPAYFPIPA